MWLKQKKINEKYERGGLNIITLTYPKSERIGNFRSDEMKLSFLLRMWKGFGREGKSLLCKRYMYTYITIKIIIIILFL